jgi:hypothetical protein
MLDQSFKKLFINILLRKWHSNSNPQGLSSHWIHYFNKGNVIYQDIFNTVSYFKIQKNMASFNLNYKRMVDEHWWSLWQ